LHFSAAVWAGWPFEAAAGDVGDRVAPAFMPDASSKAKSREPQDREDAWPTFPPGLLAIADEVIE
jgi:hypothetical protein